MDGARDDFLAGAGFAQNQDRRVGGRHLCDPRHHAAQAAVGADDGFAQAAAPQTRQ